MCVWRLLMRAGERNPGLEPGWRLDIDGQLSRDLREALEIIMRDEAFHGEFLEFEGSKDAVAVYWEEWGGLPMAERLTGYLRRLARIA
jgi:hypothetical protein